MPSPTQSKKHPTTGARPPVHWMSVLWLFAVYVVVALFWDSDWVYPLRLLVVFFHEISHALAAWITGGQVIEIQVFKEEGGHCITCGGNQFLILSAGYLGSLAFGASILLISSRTQWSDLLAGVLGLLLVGMSVLYVPMSENAYGKVFGTVAGLGLASLSLVPPRGARAVLNVVGLTSCLYVLVDVKSDVLDRSVAGSDASALQELTGVPGFLWGLVWIAVSAWVTLVAVKWSELRKSTTPAPRKGRS